MKRVPEIHLDTPLRPRAIAEAVWEEATLWLGQPLPRRWLRELIAEANGVYANNARFRRKLRAEGDSEREWLWLFTRHWLAALIHERRPRLHGRVPASFNRGEALPEPRREMKSEKFKVKNANWARERGGLMRAAETLPAWALAAHFS